MVPESVPTWGNLQYNAAVRQLDKVVYGLIRERRLELQAGREGRDLLDNLLTAKDEVDGGYMADPQVSRTGIVMGVAGKMCSSLYRKRAQLSRSEARHALLDGN